MILNKRLFLLFVFVINHFAFPKWEGINIVYGHVRLIYSDNNILFAATENSLYKSVDEGKNWSGNLLPSLSYRISISSIARCGKFLFLGGWGFDNVGVLRSSDDGDTWEPINFYEQDVPILAKAASFLVVGDSLFVGTYEESSICLLTDGGTKIKRFRLNDPSKNLTINSLEKAGTVLFAENSVNGIFRSTDFGNSWIKTDTRLVKNNKEILAFTVADDTLFAGTTGSGDDNVLFFSTDSGDSWQNMGLNLPYKYEVKLIKSINGAIYVIGYAPYKSVIYKTSDKGLTWKLINLPTDYFEYASLCYYNRALYLGLQYTEGIYKSTDDGASWNECGLKKTNLTCFTMNRSKKYLFLGTDHGEVILQNFDSEDKKYYNSLLSGLPASASILSLKFQATLLLAGTSEGFFYLDYPENLKNKKWIAQNDGLPTDSVTSIISAENNNRIYIGTNSGVYTTDYFKHSWNRINTGLTNFKIRSLILSVKTVFAGTEEGVFALTYPETNWHPLLKGLSGHSKFINSITLIGNHIFIGTKNGVYKSTYSIPEWKPAGLTNMEINAVDALEGIVFAATKNSGVYYTSNFGDTWLPLYSDIKSANVYSLACDIGHVWAVSEGGWFNECSFNKYVVPVLIKFPDVQLDKRKVTIAWQTSKEINTLGFEIQRQFDFENDFITLDYLGGKGNSWKPADYSFADSLPTGKFKWVIYRLKQFYKDESYSYSNTAEIPGVNCLYNDAKELSFNLLQNYPNPFNLSTTIEYSIKYSGFLKIEVFDILGRKIKILKNENVNPGVYKIYFDASGLSSGIYIYRLEINNISLNKTMILLK